MSLVANRHVFSVSYQFASVLQPHSFDQAFNPEACNHQLCPICQQFHWRLSAATQAVAGTPHFASENRAGSEKLIGCVYPTEVIVSYPRIAAESVRVVHQKANYECARCVMVVSIRAV